MDEDDRDFPPEEWQARIEAAYRRLKAGLPPVPWLPRVTDLTDLRRQVRRVRAGTAKPYNSQLSPRAWADTVEMGIVLNELEMREELREIEEDRQWVLKYKRCWMDLYRALKRLPEAADPESEVGAEVLSMKRELRQARGRPRRKRKRRAEG